MATSGVREDKYRTFLYGEGEKNTKWRYGSPPNYDDVNKLFEEGRTKVLKLFVWLIIAIYIYPLLISILLTCWCKVWPSGSLEEKVQNLVKTWEMEMFHKTCFDDYKSVDPKNYTFSLNGK